MQSQDYPPFKGKKTLARWFYATKGSRGFPASSFDEEELEYVRMWNIFMAFQKLPWEWDVEEPNIKDMNAMEQMMSWHNDRARMDQEKAEQKAHKSSNTRGTTYKLD